METLTIDLPEALVEALDDLAARSGRARDELVYDAVRALVVGQTPAASAAVDPSTWPRSFGMGDADAPRAEEIDDWLKANWRPDAAWRRP